MKNNNTFHLTFSENWFQKRDILTDDKKQELIVLETPHKKWYKQLLQFISFGLYKAPYQYKIKLI
jgi:endonuclease IV